jgi:hypothetical protein
MILLIMKESKGELKQVVLQMSFVVLKWGGEG